MRKLFTALAVVVSLLAAGGGAPVAKQALIVEAFYGGQWHDATADEQVYARSPVTYRRGLTEESGQPDPGRCGLLMDNRAGTWNPENPVSPLYGLAGRNTPIRIRYQVLAEDFEDTPLAISVTLDGSANWARSTTEAHAGTWSYKAGTVTHDQFSRATVAVPAGANTATFWYKVSSEADFDFFAVYVDGALAFFDSGEVDWTQTDVDVTGADDVAFVYIKDEAVSDGDDTAWVDDLVFSDVRWSGVAAQWQPGRAVKGDAWTSLTGAGVLRRVQRGKKPVLSPLTRFTLGYGTPGLLGWWPLEADLTSPQPGYGPGQLVISPFGSGILQPLKLVTGDNVVGTDALVDLSNGTRIDFPVIPHAAPTGSYVVRWVATFAPGDPPGLALDALRLIFSGGSVERINFEASADDGFAEVALVTTSSGDFGFGTTTLYDGVQRFYQLTITQSGADVIATLLVDNAVAAVATIAATLGVLTSASFNFVGDATAAAPAVGQLSIWRNTSPDSNIQVAAAGGYPGETTAERFERLCEDAGLPSTVVGDTADCPTMGPQRSAKLVDLLAEVVDTDGGMVYESRGEAGLTMRTLRSMYNRDPALTIDYTQINHPLVPVVGDVGIVNDVTARAPTGAVGRAQETTGPLSVADPPDGIGVYDAKVDPNPQDLAELVDVAGWAVHRGTPEGPRYRQVILGLNRETGIATAMGTVDVGDLVALVGLPADDSPDDQPVVPVWVEESIPTHDRTLTMGTVPGGTLEVGIVGAEDGSVDLRGQAVDTDLSTLATGVSAPSPVGYRERFATSDGGWAGTNVSVARSTTVALRGIASLLAEVTVDDPLQYPRSPAVSVTVGQTWHAWWWVYSVAGVTLGLGIDWEDSGGGYVSGEYPSGVVVPAATWTRMSVTGVVPSGVAAGRFGPTLSDESVGVQLWIADANMRPVGTLSVAAGALWTTDADDWDTGLHGAGRYGEGLHIRVGGEVMRVTSISGASSPQSMTVVRAVNGVIKAHSSGAAVHVDQPVIVGR